MNNSGLLACNCSTVNVNDSNANDTRPRNRYRKLVPGNLYQFSGTSFSYQMKLEAKFLVPKTNMADENVEADAQNNTLLRNITPTNTGNHPHTQM